MDFPTDANWGYRSSQTLGLRVLSDGLKPALIKFAQRCAVNLLVQPDLLLSRRQAAGWELLLALIEML